MGTREIGQGEPEHVEPLAARLRRFHTATMQTDDLVEQVRFVVDGRDGSIVLPVHARVLQAEQVVLFVPEESEPDSLQLLVSVREIVDWRSQEVCDKWAAYHGRAVHGRWAALTIDGGWRVRSEVSGAETLWAVNPLLAHEASLCKHCNSDRQAVAAACRRLAGVDVPGALVVGVDIFGLDVRAAHGIIRLDFQRPAETHAEALTQLASVLGGP
jgi:hypothetical protein